MQKQPRRKGPESAVNLRAEYARLGRWLGQQREAAGISQRALSRLVGKPESYINKVELGLRRIDLVEFLDIARAVKMDSKMPLAELLKASEAADN
jgi:transcriptional regulator with XRE-family HTH domain